MNLWANGVYDADILCQNSLFETPYDFPPADIAVGHFPFGLFVDTQTVKEQPYIAIPFAVSNTPSLDGNGLFIQRMLYQLHEKGKACIVLPLQVTYKDRLDRRLREFLLRRDWIDTIIALPAGLLPTTGTPVSVWVIQKSKPAHRKDKVLFINAFNIESQARTRLSKSLADAQIGEIFQAYKLGEAKADSFLSDNVAFVPTIYVMDNEYNLNPKQYASRFIQKLNQLRTTQQLIPLNQLFGKEQAFVWFDTQNPPPRPLPFVQPSNLGNSFAEYPLAPNILQTSEQVGIFEGRLLNSSALLVYTKSNKLKVSYYEHNQDAVLVSKDILVLFIEDPHLNIEYLLLQLHADLFAEQMLLYKSDHLDTELSEREFVHLQIILPERLIQDRIVRETKTQLLRAEENKVEALRQTLNLGKQKSQNEQYKIISSLQHELGNRLPAVLTEFKNLKDFIHDKIDAQTPLDWNEPIFPLFEDENPDTVDTLADTVRRIEQLLRNTLNTLDATSSIISADKTRLQLQPVSVKNFLENIASLYKNEPHFSIQIEIETDEAGKEIDFVAKMDVTQMETLFVNFIENAKRHGFVHDKKYLIRFRVGLSEDEKELIIEYENDGRPFPSNFSFEDFISFGNYAGETGHSGIGGYLINQIIENHEGTLSYRTQIDRNDPFKVQFEICLPYVRR